MMRLEDMNEHELAELMRQACERLKFTFPPGTGFIVLASSTDGGIAQYASNCDRDDCMLWMLETIQRWLKRDYVPRDNSNSTRKDDH